MSRIWFLYGMNYAQNFILHGRRGAWSVRAKNLTNLNKPNFSQLIFIIGFTKVHTGIGMEVMQEGR